MVICLSPLLVSCDFISPIKQAVEVDKEIDSAFNLLEKSTARNYGHQPIWSIGFDERTGDLIPIQTRKVLSDTLTFEKLRLDLLLSYPEVGVLRLMNQRGDTLYVEVSNGSYLTQQMGTTGAQEFLMAATYTLTELEEVGYVKLIFEEGDHAQPGVYSRKSW